MKVGFTGTQKGMTGAQKVAFRNLVSKFRAKEFHHGDCIGADADAHDIARELGIYIVGHPPKDPKKRAFKECDVLRPEYEYITRNHHIVDETRYLVATPAEYEEQLRSGTWSTVRYGRKNSCVFIIQPDGKVL